MNIYFTLHDDGDHAISSGVDSAKIQLTENGTEISILLDRSEFEFFRRSLTDKIHDQWGQKQKNPTEAVAI